MLTVSYYFVTSCELSTGRTRASSTHTVWTVSQYSSSLLSSLLSAPTPDTHAIRARSSGPGGAAAGGGRRRGGGVVVHVEATAATARDGALYGAAVTAPTATAVAVAGRLWREGVGGVGGGGLRGGGPGGKAAGGAPG